METMHNNKLLEYIFEGKDYVLDLKSPYHIFITKNEIEIHVAIFSHFVSVFSDHSI